MMTDRKEERRRCLHAQERVLVISGSRALLRALDDLHTPRAKRLASKASVELGRVAGMIPITLLVRMRVRDPVAAAALLASLGAVIDADNAKAVRGAHPPGACISLLAVPRHAPRAGARTDAPAAPRAEGRLALQSSDGRVESCALRLLRAHPTVDGVRVLGATPRVVQGHVEGIWERPVGGTGPRLGRRRVLLAFSLLRHAPDRRQAGGVDCGVLQDVGMGGNRGLHVLHPRSRDASECADGVELPLSDRLHIE